MNTNTPCIVSFFFQNLSRVTNPNRHQIPHTNKNCYYNPQLREGKLEDNILGCLPN